jgi:outer membrane biogenesis lipoprotein LolB
MISRRILPIVALAILAACASPSDPEPTQTADNQRPNTTESAPSPADTVGRGGNVMGGGH